MCVVTAAAHDPVGWRWFGCTLSVHLLVRGWGKSYLTMVTIAEFGARRCRGEGGNSGGSTVLDSTGSTGSYSTWSMKTRKSYTVGECGAVVCVGVGIKRRSASARCVYVVVERDGL